MSELLSRLHSETEEARRAALEEAAGTQDETIVRAMLTHTMNPSMSDSERQFAAECLAKCSHGEITPALLPLLKSDQAIARTLAAIGLGGQSSPAVIVGLIQALTDAVNTVRNWAERSLLGQIAAVREHGIAELLKLLGHTVPLSRSPAARILGLTQDARAVQPLMQMAEADPEWLPRMAAVRALGDHGSGASVELLRRLLTSDPKNRVRAAAAEAIGKLRPTDAESLLRTALETDADAGVQKSAGEALRALGFEVDEINDGGWE
jgi:HEAT repeat protein